MTSIAVGALLTLCACYNVAILIVAMRFRRGARGETPDCSLEALAVSILVPLEGAEPGLFENLSAYLELQHAAPIQIVVGSLDPGDRALETARLVAQSHPGADFQVVAGATSIGPNRKASLLATLSRHARHPIVAVVDSDVRVRPDYLSQLMPVLRAPGVGLVSCLYRAPRSNTAANTYEALCINTDFIPSVMLASALGRGDIALGASLVLRKSTLDRVGGFAAVAGYLADDHRLGELVTALDLRVALAPYVVESDPNPGSLAGAVRHQLRWGRTLRACAPLGYLGSVVSHGMTFALAVAAVPFSTRTSVLLALTVILLRLVAASRAARAIGARLGWTVLLVPLRDVTATGIWIASLAGNRIEWRGRHYRIAARGRLLDTVSTAVWSPAPTIAAAEVRRSVNS